MKYFFTMLLASGLWLSTSAQNDGELDLTFNTTGYAEYQVGASHDNVNNLHVMPDGKIIFSGVTIVGANFNFGVHIGRLNSDGSLDESFGTNGYYTYSTMGGSSFAYDMYVYENGKILIVGGYSITAANTGFLLIRLNADGSTDNSFGTGGIVNLNPDSGEDYGKSLEILDDGSIFVIGESAVPGFTYTRICLTKISSSGVQDTNFGTNGWVNYSATSTSSYSIYKSTMHDNRIYFVGSEYIASLFGEYPILGKVNFDGEFDTAIGDGDGIVSDANEGYYFDIATDGNTIHVVGSYSDQQSAIVLGYNTDGSLNPGFGVNGVSSISEGPLSSWNSIAYQQDGKLVMTGVTGSSIFDRQVMTGRINPDGSIDNSFSDNGSVVFDLGSLFDVGNDVVLQPDGQILVGGITASSNNNLLFIRYHGSPTEILPFSASLGTTQDLSCFGDNNGTASIIISGGQAPYSVFLDNGSTNVGSTITGLSGGNHTVLVNDAVGNVAIVGFVINEPPILTLDATATGNDINATAVGGTPPYNYSIGVGSQPTGEFLNLPMGNYQVYVFDANGCQTSVSTDILVGTQLPDNNRIRIQPTLSDGRFNIITDVIVFRDGQVYSQDGRLMRTFRAATGTLDLTDLPVGTYYIRIENTTTPIVIVR